MSEDLDLSRVTDEIAGMVKEQGVNGAVTTLMRYLYREAPFGDDLFLETRTTGRYKGATADSKESVNSAKALLGQMIRQLTTYIDSGEIESAARAKGQVIYFADSDEGFLDVFSFAGDVSAEQLEQLVGNGLDLLNRALLAAVKQEENDWEEISDSKTN